MLLLPRGQSPDTLFSQPLNLNPLNLNPHAKPSQLYA
jgi:hypothetical protein